jgi:hypothetical protein
VLTDNGHRYAAVEYLTTGVVFAGWAAVRYFKDDHGRAFTERGVEQTGSVLAMIGCCCSLLLCLRLVVNLFAFKAAPFPRNSPATSSTTCVTSGIQQAPAMALPRQPPLQSAPNTARSGTLLVTSHLSSGRRFLGHRHPRNRLPTAT